MRVTRREEARMRGGEDPQAEVWSYLPLEQRVPADHPLRPMRAMVDAVLAELSPELSRLYSRVGRPSIAPERLLRALLLQVLYSVRSERLLMEQLDYNLLFRWFVGLKADDPIWDATVFTKNRHGLAVNGSLTPASGFAERDQGLLMAAQLPRRATLGADKSYDTRDFVDGLRGLDVTPHLAQNSTKRSSAIDRRTTRHAGYGVSQRRRKRIEEIFGWLKTVGLLRKTRHRGVARVGWMFVFGLAVYNLVRIRNLMGEPT